MMARCPRLATFLRDIRGTMAVETALVVPVLALMSVGSFEISGMVARQTELQTAAAEAAQIVLASPPETTQDLYTIKQIIMTSAGLPASRVALNLRYRCAAKTSLRTNNNCGTGEKVSSYVRINMTDTYQPGWTQFGVGSAMNYNVTRLVMIS